MIKFILSLFKSSCKGKDAGLTYSPFNCSLSGQTGIQGIRGVTGSSDVYVSGTLNVGGGNALGLIYKGPLSHNSSLGQWYTFTYTQSGVDDVINTSCYGPNNFGSGVEFVGSYKRTSTGKGALGCLYQGPLDGSGTWTNVVPNGGATKNVYVHSLMGGYAVGNYDTKLDNGFAFIYDIQNKSFEYIVAPNALSTTLYGIWHNGNTSYTLVGGYSQKELGDASQAFIADWDSSTKALTNFKAYQGFNSKVDSLVTHFEGITLGCDGYNVAAGDANKTEGGAAFVNIKRNKDGSFGEAKWTQLKYPDNNVQMITSDTVYQKNVLGLMLSKAGMASYLVQIK